MDCRVTLDTNRSKRTHINGDNVLRDLIKVFIHVNDYENIVDLIQEHC